MANKPQPIAVVQKDSRESLAWAILSDGSQRPATKKEASELPKIARELADGLFDVARKARAAKDEAAAEAARRKQLRHYRVRWTEEYQQVREATSENEAMEERDDADAFQGCLEITAQEVERCYKAAPGGRKECAGCDECESGWRPVKEA